MKIQPWYVIGLLIQVTVVVLAFDVYWTYDRSVATLMTFMWVVFPVLQVLFLALLVKRTDGWLRGLAEGSIIGITCFSVFVYGTTYFSEVAGLFETVAYMACAEFGVIIAFYLSAYKVVTGEWYSYEYDVHDNQDLIDLLEKATKKECDSCPPSN